MLKFHVLRERTFYVSLHYEYLSSSSSSSYKTMFCILSSMPVSMFNFRTNILETTSSALGMAGFPFLAI